MNLLAAATVPSTTPVLEKLRAIPPQFWLLLGVVVVVLMILVLLVRSLGKMNKAVLTVVAVVVATMVGFNWIYERDEPAWATPFVGILANFFPSKGPPAKPAPSPVAKRLP
jgi:apolipoprotein N-acyltransferase